MSELSDDDLLDALGIEVVPDKANSRTPLEERIIAGFEDILRFFDIHGRRPQHGETNDIFERLYAVRLDRLRVLPEAQELLAPLDIHGNFFILGGQLVYVAETGESIRAPNGESDARLRVIYSNGTESNLLRRSLQRALYKDEGARRLSDPNAGPLFSEEWDEDDIESGTIYVLRSQSKHPYVVEHRELIHKIGVTGGKIETRIANAALDSTYLLADVEIVATYKLAGINRTKLENIFHRIFASVQLSLTIQDRFGHPVRPREWFLVPIHVIDEAVKRVIDGSIADMVYDPKTACLV